MSACQVHLPGWDSWLIFKTWGSLRLKICPIHLFVNLCSSSQWFEDGWYKKACLFQDLWLICLYLENRQQTLLQSFHVATALMMIEPQSPWWMGCHWPMNYAWFWRRTIIWGFVYDTNLLPHEQAASLLSLIFLKTFSVFPVSSVAFGSTINVSTGEVNFLGNGVTFLTSWKWLN